MLVEFKVGNFLSFHEDQTFSMEAGKVRNNIDRVYIDNKFKLLKFMAIYGANASGKSNLISAFDFAQTVILEGLPTSSINQYCRLMDENKNKSSRFEFTIKINDKKYIYGFDVILHSSAFIKEWLKEVSYGTNCKLIFERDVSTGEYEVHTYFKDKNINDRLKIYADDVKSDESALFLRIMNQNKDSLYATDSEVRVYRRIFNWFKYSLSVNQPEKPVTNYSYLMDSENVHQIDKLLSAFGTGISKIDIANVTLEKVATIVPKRILQDIIDDLNEQKKQYEKRNLDHSPAVMIRSAEEHSIFIIELDGEDIQCKTFEFRHENTDAIFSLNEESDGTIRLLDLIEILLNDGRERVYIIDEINRRFHPLLTVKFIEKYLELAKERNIQLIVTTHESKLMDFELLRKDEIGFVNKDDDGISEFFSMDKFSERFDKKVYKAYFDGKYKAIPKFKK